MENQIAIVANTFGYDVDWWDDPSPPEFPRAFEPYCTVSTNGFVELRGPDRDSIIDYWEEFYGDEVVRNSGLRFDWEYEDISESPEGVVVRATVKDWRVDEQDDGPDEMDFDY